MSTRRLIEYALGAVTIVLATVAIAIPSPILGLLSLVAGAIGYGMLIATP